MTTIETMLIHIEVVFDNLKLLNYIEIRINYISSYAFKDFR